MKTHVLRGSKADIAEGLARITGEVREAIVFVDEPVAASAAGTDEDIFSEMQPYEVHTDTTVDDSREGIYSRLDGE